VPKRFSRRHVWIGVESGTPVYSDKVFETTWKFNLGGVPIDADRDPAIAQTFRNITAIYLA